MVYSWVLLIPFVLHFSTIHLRNCLLNTSFRNYLIIEKQCFKIKAETLSHTNINTKYRDFLFACMSMWMCLFMHV